MGEIHIHVGLHFHKVISYKIAQKVFAKECHDMILFLKAAKNNL